MADRVIFLPGASGDRSFWAPVAERLQHPSDQLLDWPGFGKTPRSPHVHGLQDLATLVLSHIDRPVDVVAQSMGGVVAVEAALRRPGMIRHLVLTATSGGVNMTRFNVQDWRSDYQAAYRTAPRWFVDDRTYLSAQIPSIQAPTLIAEHLGSAP